MPEYPTKLSSREISLLVRSIGGFFLGGAVIGVASVAFFQTGSGWWLVADAAAGMTVLISCWYMFIKVPDMIRSRRLNERRPR